MIPALYRSLLRSSRSYDQTPLLKAVFRPPQLPKLEPTHQQQNNHGSGNNSGVPTIQLHTHKSNTTSTTKAHPLPQNPGVVIDDNRILLPMPHGLIVIDNVGAGGASNKSPTITDQLRQFLAQNSFTASQRQALEALHNEVVAEIFLSTDGKSFYRPRISFESVVKKFFRRKRSSIATTATTATSSTASSTSTDSAAASPSSSSSSTPSPSSSSSSAKSIRERSNVTISQQELLNLGFLWLRELNSQAIRARKNGISTSSITSLMKSSPIPAAVKQQKVPAKPNKKDKDVLVTTGEANVWAKPAPHLQVGSVLVSHPLMVDGFFRRRVVLLTEKTLSGWKGLAINSPVREHLPLCDGGPVGTQDVHVVFSPEVLSQQSAEVKANVVVSPKLSLKSKGRIKPRSKIASQKESEEESATSSVEEANNNNNNNNQITLPNQTATTSNSPSLLIQHAVKLSDSLNWGLISVPNIARFLDVHDPAAMKGLRFFETYSSWVRGQLEEEMTHGVWLPAQVSESILMSECYSAEQSDAFWTSILRLMGDEYASFADMPVAAEKNYREIMEQEWKTP